MFDRTRSSQITEIARFVGQTSTAKPYKINSLAKSILRVRGPRFAPSECDMLTMTRNLVVITSAATVSTWRMQLEGQPNAKIFSDADFLLALEIIINERPDVIALDPIFAATARGAALVARVKADPALRGAEVRTLVGDGVGQPLVPSSAEGREGTAAMLSQQLDSYGTRGAPRFEMQADVEAKVNGTAGRLVNLSITGSQLLAPIRVRPAEGIRVTLSDDSSDVRLAGIIAWVNLEIAARAAAQRYRFGVEFRDADRNLLESFCLRHKQE
jgi:PilZ domain-containing protein